MRRRQRHHQPPAEPLAYAVAAHKAVVTAVRDAESERDRAMLSAANAGWSMREIGQATGLSPSTVCRMVNRAEREQP